MSEPSNQPVPQVRKPVARGDRGNVYKREILLKGRTAKDMGIRKGFKKRVYFYAKCDHVNKKGKKNCNKSFGGYSIYLVMGNKALHEKWHDEQDRKAAETAGLN